jgi:hypothetical protein
MAIAIASSQSGARETMMMQEGFSGLCRHVCLDQSLVVDQTMEASTLLHSRLYFLLHCQLGVLKVSEYCTLMHRHLCATNKRRRLCCSRCYCGVLLGLDMQAIYYSLLTSLQGQ